MGEHRKTFRIKFLILWKNEKRRRKDIEKTLTFRSIKGTNPEVGDFDEF